MAPFSRKGGSEKNVLAKRGGLALFEFLGREWIFSGEGAEGFLKVFLRK